MSNPLELPARSVTLVLCRRDGSLLGALPTFDVVVPWWQEVWPVVEAARGRFGVDLTVLRILPAVAGSTTIGGPVSYLAEVTEAQDLRALPPLTPWLGHVGAREPLRQTWAEPGGPQADIDWADSVLAGLGTPRNAPAAQKRSWNLSSLWRLPTASGAAWLKVVPPFFGHEGAMLSRLDPAVVPPLLASDGPRVLLAELPGEDHYGATGAVLLHMVSMLVGLQAEWMGQTAELLSLGLPDWRLESLKPLIDRTIAASANDLDPATLEVLDELMSTLDRRFAELATCGIPDTLVHGDFHPGNVRGSSGGDAGTRLALLDWGDCGVGHPLLDQAAFTQRLSEADRLAVAARWARLWRAAVPGSEPERAAALLAPVAALRQTVIYRMFLDNIEPDERIYHVSDPAVWLTEASRRFATGEIST